MNKIKNLFVIILFALVAFSCSDILDKGPLDKYSENDVWKSTDLTQAFIYTALANATNMMVWKDNWTDNEAIMEDGRDVNAELIDRYYDAGWNKYEDIRRCNMVLARVPEAPFTNAEKANFIAQAKTIRAMIYFTRARLFGKLMLVKELIDPEADMKFPRTATVKETYDFILQVFHITRDFGREYKYTLGQDMKKEAISLVRNIYRANKTYNKTEYLLIFVIFGLEPNISFRFPCQARERQERIKARG